MINRVYTSTTSHVIEPDPIEIQHRILAHNRICDFDFFSFLVPEFSKHLLSGLLTARLLLHFQEWDYQQEMSIYQDSQPEQAGSYLFFKHDLATSVSTMLYSDFGLDPIALPDEKDEVKRDEGLSPNSDY
ncbi:hypothetical protein GYMLUDRAFT_65140 [Collybiopsis luxurians FD-317 M1]|uniref:Uncharacterized protein n=1 Tax=Collybiopsis luxurians FD-317 M1 TaxID=944289 RepID=A0A0D0C7L2_9AGAR|nr:hypothetical protein GYMLUDRAFT_65140 [Collybiopsis luxurians FD-317 M1]